MASKEGVDRIPTGIPVLDKLIEGGFVKGSTILVSGGAGTGKTIFSMQYLLEGLKNGENCMFITLEETPEDLVADVARFGWDLQKHVQSKKLLIEYHDPFQMTDITSLLVEKINEKKISRIVIDSTSLFGLYFKDPFEVRKQLFKLLMGLKGTNATSVLTSELSEEEKKLSRFGVEEFIVDGVIVLHYLGVGEATYNNVEVRKMRRTNHAKGTFQI